MLKENSEEFKNRISEYEDKMKNKKEKWKIININDVPTKYMISNFGNICNTKNGKVKLNDYGKQKYVNIELKDGNMIIKSSLHRLVASYFCKIPKRLLDQGLTYKDLVVNHKNGIKTCNASFNLEWVTQYENMEHAFRTKLCTGIFGENSHLSNISNKEAQKICELIMDKKTNKEISDMLGITEKTIQHIRSGECWKAISQFYNFPKLAEAVPYSKDEEVIHQICKVLEEHKYSDGDIAKKFDVHREYVRDIRNGKLRNDISSQYKIDKTPYNPINDEMIENVCKLLEKGGMSQKKIADSVGVSQWLVSEIYNHKKFTNISKKYNFNL